jgi:capsular exopolysaccharide synthesis family protein
MLSSSERNGFDMPQLNNPPPGKPLPAPAPQQGYGYGYGYGYGARQGAEMTRTWHNLIEKSWLIVLLAAICLGLGFYYTKHAQVLYSATATIQAEEDQPNIFRMQMIQIRDLGALDYLQTVAQSLTNRPLLKRVADTNNLWTDPRFTNFISAAPHFPSYTNKLWTDPRLTNRLSAAPGFASDTNNTPSRKRALDALERMVKVKLRRGTRLIDITVTHPVPELTEMIANSIVNEYVNEGAERQDTTIGLASKSLAKEAEQLRKKLSESENALQDYVEQSKVSSLDERQNTVVAKLKELSTSSTEAKSLRIRTETEYAQIVNLGTNVEAMMTVPAVAKDPTVLALQLNLIKAEEDFAALCQRYKEKHPKYIQARTQIAELKADIAAAVTNAIQTLKATLDSAKAAEEAINQAMQAQEVSSIELSKLAIQYSVLSREVESDRALYDAVLKGMKEASVTKETQQTGIIRVVQPAFVPDMPIWPRKFAIMVVSGLGGIFLGVLIIMGLQISDTSIKTVDEAEKVLSLSVFSAVPHIQGLNNNGQHPLVVVDDAKSEGAEAIRTLRTSLSMMGRAANWRVFLFTSALPSEGKTFCTVNFAASLAQLGLKALIIDGDLRRPSVEIALLGAATTNPGVTDYLTGQKNLAEVVRPTKVENLFFISAGTTAANPAELLAKDGLEGLLKNALQHYDRVVVDSAPIAAVSDTLLMLKSVQTVCLVVRAAHTSSRYVLRCAQLLKGAEGALSGIVLNQMPRRRGFGLKTYYDYRYHGKYGKKGVYGAS